MSLQAWLFGVGVCATSVLLLSVVALFIVRMAESVVGHGSRRTVQPALPPDESGETPEQREGHRSDSDERGQTAGA